MFEFFYPLIAAFRFAFIWLFGLTGSISVALLLLSLLTSSLVIFLGWLLRAYPQREALVQQIMAPQIREINQNFSKEARHQKLRKLYHRYRYHPILSLRSAFPLFIQLPFLIAAYQALSHLSVLQGQSWLWIADISVPDGSLSGYNLLPFVMTVVNLTTAMLNPAFNAKDRLQATVIALVFLVLLYNSPAALLVYWTMNNLIFLLRTLYSRVRTQENKTDKTAGEESKLQSKLSITEFLNSSTFQHYMHALNALCFLLILGYLLQFGFDAEQRFLSRVSKTVPLFVASLLFWLSTGLGLPCKLRIRTLISSFGLLIPLCIGLAHLIGVFPFTSHDFIIFPISAGILFGLTLLLHLLHAGKAKSSKIMAKDSFTGVTYLLLLPMIPLIHLATVNPDYLSGWFYPLLFFVSPVLSLSCYFLLRLLFRRVLPKQMLIVLAGVFTFSYLVLPVIRAILSRNSSHDADFWLIMGSATAIISYLYSKPKSGVSAWQKLSRMAIGLLFVMGIVSFIFGFGTQARVKTRELSPIPQILQNRKILNSPNIYLFVYDGIPNQRVFTQQQLPFAGLHSLLQKHGYKLYDDTYTIGSESLTSMAMTLNITSETYSSQSQMQDIYSGNSVANLFLRKQGYSTYKLLENYYTGTAAISNKNLVTQYFPPKELSNVQADFFLILLRGIFQGELKFDTKGILAKDRYTEADRQAMKHKLIRMHKQKSFVLDHYSQPSHSQNSGKCLPNETELWIGRYNKALKQMQSDLETIEQHDPRSIVILIGDHGPALSGDCYVLQDWKREEITPELIWDRIGTMLAIKWDDPAKATKFDADLTLNQDIFAVLFAYLCNDPALLSLQPDRTFTGYGLITRPPVSFKHGKMIY